MKINNITTIVDLAFNLSGSLAGIPVILPQLPVGEKVGFDTLPDVWEDVDDIGQTWTPDLDGVEVDITVEAYNPTAIQKAPYSSDMKCIETATNLGNTLLPILTWDENLERGGISLATGQLISTDANVRTVDFIPILGDTYVLNSRGLYVSAAMMVYDESYSFVDYWTISPNFYREVDVSNASFFKVVIFSLDYKQGGIQIKPKNF